MPHSLVEHPCLCGSIEKLNPRLTFSFVATRYATDTGTVLSSTCLQRAVAAYLQSEGHQLVQELQTASRVGIFGGVAVDT
jgi:hypothetical protein